MYNNKKRIFDYVVVSGNSVTPFEGKKLYFSTGGVEGFAGAEEVTYFNKPTRANLVGKSGDLLIAKMAKTNKVILLNSETEQHIYSTGFYCLEPKNINTDFLYFLLKSEEFNQEKDSQSVGTTQVSLNLNGLKKINISFVDDIKKQSIIAAKLKNITNIVDEIIWNNNKQIEKIINFKKQIISEIITRGLKGEPVKKTGIDYIGEISENFDLIRLKDTLETPLYYGTNKSSGLYSETKPRYIRITDIQNEELINDVNLMQSYYHDDFEKYSVNENDILLARSGATVGKTYMVKAEDKNSVFAGYLINAKINRRVLSPFFFYYVTKSRMWDEWRNSVLIQSTIENISASKYATFTFPIPSLKEQIEIVDFLNSTCVKIDKLINYKNEKTKKLELYKTSIIYEYVTGKRNP